MSWLLCAVLLASSPDLARSMKLTTAAEQLFEYEKKMASAAPERIDDLLFGDVLSLLDVAISTNPANLHGRALRSEVLMLRSFDVDEATYDVCYIIDAKADATYVVSRAARASAPDLKTAKDVLRGIDLIPPDAIPDPPSVCDDEEDRGSRTKNR
jgi:hypothetical protein